MWSLSATNAFQQFRLEPRSATVGVVVYTAAVIIYDIFSRSHVRNLLTPVTKLFSKRYYLVLFVANTRRNYDTGTGIHCFLRKMTPPGPTTPRHTGGIYGGKGVSPVRNPERTFVAPEYNIIKADTDKTIPPRAHLQ